jgi:hypothetical protein
MIIRKMTKHIREQNWFAVSVDALVVVVGIFLGLQVTNWQANINEQKTAEKYLVRLQSDLQNDLARMNFTHSFWILIRGYSEQSLEYLEEPENNKQDSWQQVLAFFQASQIDPFSVNNITYNELQQAGQLSLLESHELRQDLAEYYSFNGSDIGTQLMRYVPAYRERIRGFIPSKVTNYIWTNCYENANVDNNISSQQLLDCKSPISELENRKVLDAIKADKEVLMTLRFWYSTQTSALQFLPTNIKTATELKEDVKKEIELLRR